MLRTFNEMGLQRATSSEFMVLSGLPG